MNKSTYHVFFTNFANPLKVNIVVALKEKDKNVSELVKELGIEQSKISHALASLRACNIVGVKQKGKQRIYSLNKRTILPMLKLIDKHAQVFCQGNCFACEGCAKTRRKK
ncbi:metalloregulator ArsR/SmtB family transcription factor [Candidatus Pacearchaeota archaeon]|nr:metalloregulator ArsR/SmtB family transcription factor [Candidatus Pacearchaeota archaeon]